MRNIRDLVAEHNEDALLADGFDDAIVGVVQRCGMDPIACYDYNKCIQILIDSGMTYECAIEYFDFNVLGAYVGENTPVYLYNLREDDLYE